jgi:hypothetical protein
MRRATVIVVQVLLLLLLAMASEAATLYLYVTPEGGEVTSDRKLDGQVVREKGLRLKSVAYLPDGGTAASGSSASMTTKGETLYYANGEAKSKVIIGAEYAPAVAGSGAAPRGVTGGSSSGQSSGGGGTTDSSNYQLPTERGRNLPYYGTFRK